MRQFQARLKRWWWLLTYGMWRGYRATQVADRYEVKSIGTLGPAPYFEYREWWNKFHDVCTCDNEQGCNVHDKPAAKIEFKGEGVPRKIKG